jgi:hypothetical protein
MTYQFINECWIIWQTQPRIMKAQLLQRCVLLNCCSQFVSANKFNISSYFKLTFFLHSLSD